MALESSNITIGLKNRFLAICERTHTITLSICIGLLGLLCFAQFLVVLMRYVFNIGFVELQDFISYCHAVMVVLALPVSLRMDRHVRVDIFREHSSVQTTRWLDQLSYVAFLLPVFAITLIAAMPLVINAWTLQEGSREVGGLGGYFLVMTALPVSCLLMLLQAAALFLDEGLAQNSNSGDHDA